MIRSKALLKNSLTGESYQFLHKSEIPSYHFQKSLRRLPIPKVQDSVNRFLASAKAVLPNDVYTKTEASIRNFEKSEAPKLQEALLTYDKNHKDTSYISEPWFDMYLRARVPVAVNYNPFMMYAPDPDPKFNHQLTRATNLAISYARLKKSLDANVLAPEVFHLNPKKSDTNLFRKVCKTLPSNLSWFGAVAFKAFPLDMSQYKSLFCGSRIPKREKDVLYLDGTQKHFIAIYRGIPYAVRIFDDEGNILPAENVHASLNFILKQGKEAPANESIGSLTSLDRDSWADARQELENAGNSENLRKIDGGLFAICLDDLKTEEHKRLVQSLLIGDEAKNRWFDKCFQTIIDANGQATINFEHSWGDGVAVLRLMEESFKDTNKNHFVSPDTVPESHNPSNVEELKFKLTDSLKTKIEQAQVNHVKANSDLDFSTMEYEGLNRDLIKKTKLSPDSVMQLAIQMAFYSLYKEFVPTYESCSTAAFLKGRTECMRSATSATRTATLAILEEGKKDVRQLLSDCSNVHGQLVKEASMGQGFDRHLLGLKITAQRQGVEIPEFFQDAGYNRMGQFVLSTSTLSTETIEQAQVNHVNVNRCSSNVSLKSIMLIFLLLFVQGAKTQDIPINVCAAILVGSKKALFFAMDLSANPTKSFCNAYPSYRQKCLDLQDMGYSILKNGVEVLAPDDTTSSTYNFVCVHVLRVSKESENYPESSTKSAFTCSNCQLMLQFFYSVFKPLIDMLNRWLADSFCSNNDSECIEKWEDFMKFSGGLGDLINEKKTTEAVCKELKCHQQADF